MEVATPTQSEYPSTLPLNQLHVGSYNPRTVIKKGESWEDWLNTLKAHNGVYTPILVRPVTGKQTPWEIVAGQRRFLGAMDAFGQTYEIPILVKDLTDEQAVAMALSENIDRVGMNPVEEAQGAAQMLAKCDGDRAEAAKRLGWRPQFFADRLKLMACSETVRKAIISEEITLSLGEQLAGLTKADQDLMMETFRKEGYPSADEAKAMILAKTKSLTTAIFALDGCNGCPHNSATQQALFANMEAGHCMNGSCYDGKTEAVLQATVDQLKETYTRVEIVRPGDDLRVIPIRASELGDEQVTACRSCANFGAVVSGTARQTGKAVPNICFGASCYSEKEAIHKKAKKAIEEAEARAAQAASQTNASSTTETSDAATQVQQTGACEEDDGDSSGVTPGAKPTALSTAVLEFRDKFFREVILREFAVNKERKAQFVIALVLAGRGNYFQRQPLGDALKEQKLVDVDQAIITGVDQAMAAVMAMDVGKATLVTSGLGAVAIESLQRHELQKLVELANPDLGRYFVLNSDLGKSFLKVLTKNQIDLVCDEVGIKAAMDKSYQAAANGKKDEFIKAVTEVADFEYAGKVPKMLSPRYAA